MERACRGPLGRGQAGLRRRLPWCRRSDGCRAVEIAARRSVGEVNMKLLAPRPRPYVCTVRKHVRRLADPLRWSNLDHLSGSANRLQLAQKRRDSLQQQARNTASHLCESIQAARQKPIHLFDDTVTPSRGATGRSRPNYSMTNESPATPFPAPFLLSPLRP